MARVILRMSCRQSCDIDKEDAVDSQELTWRWNRFLQVIDVVYATFGLAPPSKAVKDACWNLVQGIPVDDWKHVQTEICGMEAKPRNLGKAMWAAYAQLRERRQQQKPIFPSGVASASKPHPAENPVSARVVQLVFEIKRRNPDISYCEAKRQAEWWQRQDAS
ncbi:hypothetical protein [Salidesulfovibrio brasiliensis]|uniref:hypothetical protein n=1 Tax=Salidesulfovibrio brasiliensis TaxID=221711 RepID=UPI001C439CEC|nr:hypothetical protein [Salidesulfovibrio brasiliensis]